MDEIYSELHEEELHDGAVKENAGDREVDIELHAVSNAGQTPSSTPSKEKSPGGCFRLIFHNECENGESCKYKHDGKTCGETWTYFFKLMLKSKYNPKPRSELEYGKVTIEKPSQIPRKLRGPQHGAEPG